MSSRHHNTNTRQKDVWKPAIGKKLHAEQELDNAVDKFAVKVVKNNKTVGHLFREFCGIRVEVTGCIHHCKQLCGVVEITCRLVFSCLSKVKINRLK